MLIRKEETGKAGLVLTALLCFLAGAVVMVLGYFFRRSSPCRARALPFSRNREIYFRMLRELQEGFRLPLL
jgi:hypothetical protein